MTYHVLARKWRPQTFSDLVGQTHVVKALTFALSHNQVHHAYLLTGTRGVGKTSIARIFAKSLNCETNGVSAKPCGVCESCKEITAGKFVDLIEVDAASRTGVEETRELIDSVSYLPTKGRFKVYLIDEVHMFSKSSFNALLKTLEEPPEYVKFILATTDPEKLPITILSRCLQFNLKSLTQKQICQHLVNICEAENIAYDKQALQLLADAGDGSMRDTLSMTDQAIAYGQGELNLSAVTEILGTIQPADIEAILFAIATNNPNQLSVALHRLDNYEVDARAFLIEIMKRLQRMAWAKEGIAEQLSPALLSTVGEIPKPLLHLWYDIAEKALPNLSVSGNPREAVEMTLLRMLAFVPNDWLPRHRTVLDESLQSTEEQAPAEQPITSQATQSSAPVETPTVDSPVIDQAIPEPVQVANPVQVESPAPIAESHSEPVVQPTEPTAQPTSQVTAQVVENTAKSIVEGVSKSTVESAVENPVDNSMDTSANNANSMVNYVHASPVVEADDLAQAEENFSHSYNTDSLGTTDTTNDKPSVSVEENNVGVTQEIQQPIDNNLENSWKLSEESSDEPPPSAEEISAIMKTGRDIAPPNVQSQSTTQATEVDKKTQESINTALNLQANTASVANVDNPPWQTAETVTDSLPNTNSLVSTFDWNKVVYQLGLTDYTLQFVSLGILRIEQQDNNILATLDLLPKNEVMATDESLAELQTALQNYFQQTVQVKLNLTQIEQATPSEIQQQQQIEQHNDLLTTFQKEPAVQKVLELFDGKIIEKTVKRTQ